MVVFGILVLIIPNLLYILVGLGLILVGLYIALQNAPSAGGGSI